MFIKRNRVLASSIGLMILAAVIIVACQKADRHSEALSNVFGVSAAKEWYYGTFKKSSEWLQYDSEALGVKLPDWKRGKYQKVGEMEIVEFPLIRVKGEFFIRASVNLSPEQNKRIAEGSLAGIAFIKNRDNRISVREFDYIPDWDYLSSSGFDISGNTVSTLEERFSGRLVVKKWDGSEVHRNLITNGLVVKSRGFYGQLDCFRTNRYC